MDTLLAVSYRGRGINCHHANMHIFANARAPTCTPHSGSVLNVVGEDAVIHHPAVRGEDSDS